MAITAIHKSLYLEQAFLFLEATRLFHRRRFFMKVYLHMGNLYMVGN